jgi:hypothetical protein
MCLSIRFSMHARDLVQLAALAATHAKVLVRGPDSVPNSSLEQYWVASKTRLDRWARALKRIGVSSPGPEGPMIRGLLEEIITSEMLTRVWAAVMSAYDRHRGLELMEPVARSVLVGQMEARHRVLALLVCSPRIDVELAFKLNRLRQRSDRWTDMLIGSLTQLDGAVDYAADRNRAREFGEDLRYQQSQAGGHVAWPVLLASLKVAFGQVMSEISPNADLNDKIAVSVLSCFQPGVFDSTGVFRSAWLLRIASMTQDTQGMVDELLAMEGQPERNRHAPPAWSRFSDHPRRFDAWG